MTEHDPDPIVDEPEAEAPERIVIDPDDLTLDEVEEVETMLGMPIDAIFGAGLPRATALKAVLLVLTRRDDPEATLASVGAVKLSRLALVGE